MAVTTTTAIIASAIIGAGSAEHNRYQTEKATKDDAKARAAEQQRLEEEQERIARETRPEGETLSGIEFGTGNTEFGSADDFLIEKTPTISALGSTSGRSGLGFSV